jgi:hypothetical protein
MEHGGTYQEAFLDGKESVTCFSLREKSSGQVSWSEIGGNGNPQREKKRRMASTILLAA